MKPGSRRRIKQTHTARDHTNSKTAALEIVKQSLECEVLDLEPIPQLIHRDLDAALADVIALWTGNRLAEPKERQRQIHKSVLVLLQVRPAVDQLVKLQVDEAGDQRRRGGNGRDDLPGDELGAVAVGRGDLVVLGAEVAGRGDEVNVVVGIVVLFKLGGLQLKAGELGRAGSSATSWPRVSLSSVTSALGVGGRRRWPGSSRSGLA